MCASRPMACGSMMTTASARWPWRPPDERMAELDEMYQALTTGCPVRHDGRWGIATLEVVLAIMQSAREHCEITLSHQCDAY